MDSSSLRPQLLLDHDVLLMIVTYNTDMFAHNAEGCLTALRHYSQTCKSWRYLILQTPSLWAQRIDFGDPSMSSEYWRQKVLSRSGHSRLWIRYRQPVGSEHVLHALRVAIEENWHRIQKLSIALPKEFVKKFLRRCTSIYRGAPSLELFDLSPSDPGSTLIQMPSLETLFAGHAPLLVEIHLYQSLGTTPRGSSWLTNLRILHLQTHPGDVANIWRFLPAIQATPLLEDLCASLNGDFNTMMLQSHTLPHVSLLHLKKLHLDVPHFSHMLVTLDHLVFPADCTLHIVYNDQQYVGTNTPNINVDSITRAIKGLMTFYQPASVSLTVTGQKLSEAYFQSLSPTWTSFEYEYRFGFSDEYGELFSFTRRHNGTRDRTDSANALFSAIFKAYLIQAQADGIGSCVEVVTLTMENPGSAQALTFLGPLIRSFKWLRTMSLTSRNCIRTESRLTPLEVIQKHLPKYFLDQLPTTLRVVNVGLFPVKQELGPNSQWILKLGLQLDKGIGPCSFVCLRSQLGWNFFLESRTAAES